MSELLDKQVNTQKGKIFRGSHKLLQVHKKGVVMKTKQRRKNNVHKNVIEGRKPFIMPIQKTGENDPHELWVNDYGYNEGTICLVNR